MAINLNATINNVSENVKLLTDKNWEALEQRLSVVDNYQEDIQGKADKTYVDEELAKKHNAFEYGTGLNVNTVGANTTVSVKTGEISSANSDGFVTGAVLFNAFAQKADASVLATKQNALTPGIGVTIDGNNVINIKAFALLDQVFDTTEVQDFDENRDAQGRDVLYLNKTNEGNFNMYVLASDTVGERPTFRPVGCIATKLSDLVNDASYITLSEAQGLIANIDRTLFVPVVSLPTSNIDATKIYLLPIESDDETNTFEEYIYTGKWERLGKAAISLDGYLTISAAQETYLTKEDASALYQPKGTYLTEHQDITGKADASVVYTKEFVDALISQFETRLSIVERKNANFVSASSAADIAAIEDASTKDVLLKSDDALQAVNGITFNSITVVGAGLDASNMVILSAVDDIAIDGLDVGGEKNADNNGKIVFGSDTFDVKNVTVDNGSTVYNVFEGMQDVNHPISVVTFSNIKCLNTSLLHNVFNIYAPTDNAVITIKDSSFSLDVEHSNILRISNITNASNVVVNFENIDWTYEEGAGTDFTYAGLVFYQAFGSDIAFAGDTTKTATWRFNFKNCRYNGVKVDADNFGEHNQVLYTYHVNGQGIQDAAAAGFTLNFE